ncbi:MAG TPA: 16S rRNA (cytosine(967)-C(5))-methyltransferase RsmB [Casimicrobiaceae bacterium]|nr:16S rRNA (cytosine(967)-C(5))-methyltransferase RsmB [Casimicrobiaceae bacterium]
MEEAQRQAALAVMRVLAGANVSAALAAAPPAHGDTQGRRRALVQELTYGTLRHWGTLDALVKTLASKPFADASLACLVAVALYQLEHTRAPAFAVVNHAVQAVIALGRPAAKGLVNALLRRFLRERDALLARVQRDPVARWSYPAWWIARIEREYPEQWRDILTAGNERPPLSLRANARVTTPDALVARFEQAGIAAQRVGTAGVIVQSPQPVQALPGFDDGAFSVQDAGAQLAAPLLRVQNGMRVLDACAAPGGKTTHLAELADVDIVAIDESDARLERVRENVARLRLPTGRVRIIAADAGAPDTWWDGVCFDRILADVPCTASGVIRRHPDGKWLRREEDIAGFARQQRRLLDGLWPLLAPGGLLLYATCSLFEAENDGQVSSFLAAHPEALREPITFGPKVQHRGGQLLPSLPGASHNQDGFFYALLRKT